MSDRRENIGSTVTWRPRAYHEPHTGVILAFIPAWTSMHEIATAHGVGGYHLSANDRSEVDRYLVLEGRTGARGQPISTRWYAPHASIIDKALVSAERTTT